MDKMMKKQYPFDFSAWALRLLLLLFSLPIGLASKANALGEGLDLVYTATINNPENHRIRIDLEVTNIHENPLLKLIWMTL
jgi:hypothetical protein